MKNVFSFVFIITVIACSFNKKELTYIGSTPAPVIVKTFLGIPISDSIDFIRWRLIIGNDQYHLTCQYGIGKQGTNGFVGGGKKIELTDKLTKEKNYYYLHNGNKTLAVIKLNSNLLHFLNEDKSLLNGTGGWSHTLSIETSGKADPISIVTKKTMLKDSVEFLGRTPCKELSIFPGLHISHNCNKLKWSVVLYADPRTGKPTNYRIRGTAFEWIPKIGNWEIIKGENGATIYQLDLGGKDGSIYLLRPDENVLLFSDAKGRLFVGDEDFSYTLNKKN
jgi:hypothetical protein